MEIAVDLIGQDIKRIKLAGRLDMKGSMDVEPRFTALTATNGGSFIVDMAGVDFIASIGMRILLSCAKANAARGGRLVLAGMQPMVREALEMAGIDSLIPFHDDEQAALASLTG